MTFMEFIGVTALLTIGLMGLVYSDAIIRWLTSRFGKGAGWNVLRFLVGWAVYVLFLSPIIHAGVFIGEINAR